MRESLMVVVVLVACLCECLCVFLLGHVSLCVCMVVYCGCAELVKEVVRVCVFSDQGYLDTLRPTAVCKINKKRSQFYATF